MQLSIPGSLLNNKGRKQGSGTCEIFGHCCSALIFHPEACRRSGEQICTG
jgi:hypothetical protein